MAKTQAPPKTDQQVRASIVATARWGVSNEPKVHYRESRPMPLAKKVPLTTDCSGFATLCYKVAGAPDPNGLHYDGQGYTGTLLDHGRHIPLADVKPGDLVIYGTDVVKDGHHAAIVTKVRSHTLAGIDTVSHGGERGPLTITVADEMHYQPRGVTFLRFPLTVAAVPKHVPHKVTAKPVASKKPKANPQPAWLRTALKASPMWAWFAWRDHGAPAGRRPGNIPRLVPPSWWARYLIHRGRRK